MKKTFLSILLSAFVLVNPVFSKSKSVRTSNKLDYEEYYVSLGDSIEIGTSRAFE